MPKVAKVAGLEDMGEVHKLLTEHGKQVLLTSDVDRRVLDAAAAYMAAEEGEIGFVYAGWAQASLPHRRLSDDAHWEIQTDRVSLIVQPGLGPFLAKAQSQWASPMDPAPVSSSSTFRPKPSELGAEKSSWAEASTRG